MPCPAFLITHPKAGPMLVDTGLHPSVAAKPRENFGRPGARFARPRVEPGRDLPAQLRERGIEARDLPLVVMTHLHLDHASGISEFPNSTFVISARGVERGDHGPPPASARLPAGPLRLRRSTTGWSTIDGPGLDLLLDLRPHLRPVRRRQRPARLHPGPLGGPPERDRPPARPRLRDRRRRHLHAAASSRAAPEPPRPLDRHLWRRSLPGAGAVPRASIPQAVIVPGHDPEHWPTLDAKYE